MARFLLFSFGVALLLSVGAVINFLKAAQTETTVSDLTLANIEALAVDQMESHHIVNGPADIADEACLRCLTVHVNCKGEQTGGKCIPIHCLL